MDSIESGDEDYHIFKQEDLFSEALPIMKEIRRQGKLCDVKLNVGIFFLIDFNMGGKNIFSFLVYFRSRINHFPPIE